MCHVSCVCWGCVGFWRDNERQSSRTKSAQQDEKKIFSSLHADTQTHPHTPIHTRNSPRLHTQTTHAHNTQNTNTTLPIDQVFVSGLGNLRPSPDSNTDSVGPVTAMAGQYPAIESWQVGNMKERWRLVAKGDQQFITNHQEHNRSWKVWIDLMRLCYEMCHVVQCQVRFWKCLYATVCYRRLSFVTVFPCRYRDCDCNLSLIPCHNHDCNCVGN